jgi:anti-anti-sigma factor
MNVKLDTKEKFHVITVPGSVFSADITANMADMLEKILTSLVKNVILNLKEVTEMEEIAAESLVKTQQKFYEQNASFVICEMQKKVEEQLDKSELLELMNCTPSESEAWDIVQMEEIERELLDDGSL